MSSFIIACRNPHNGQILMISEERPGEPSGIAQFKSEIEAMKAAQMSMPCIAWGCQIVEIE